MNGWPSASTIASVSPHQRGVLGDLLKSRVCIFGGTPGSGKSFATASLMKAVGEKYGYFRMAAAAPTGKAAVRLTSELTNRKIPITATTIHRMLGMSPGDTGGYDGSGWRFQHNELNPLNLDFIFADEVSMLSADLTADLLKAIRPGTNLFMVGDIGQLPPVGHGAPIRDMIAAGLPYGELTEIRRNAGDIVHACRAIRKGERFATSDSVDVAAGKNLLMVERPRPVNIISAIDQVLDMVSAKFDPAWDCQVVTAINTNSPVARTKLNQHLHGKLNPSGEKIAGNKFRMGDKVICLRNQWMNLVDFTFGQYVVRREPNEDGELVPVTDFVANGEIGRVVGGTPKVSYVEFDVPKRTVMAPNTPEKDDSVGDMTNIDLALAVTAHKMQGSSSPVVIVVLDDSRGAEFVCCREWLYTAISRAEKLCVLIGKRSVADKMCQVVAIQKRKTLLRERIKAWAHPTTSSPGRA